jgi:4-hydroxy-3-methylbut-2-enyl diphosphate reductase
VDDASAVDPEWLAGASTVGVSSGASVPEVLVDGLLARLSELGFSDVEEVEAVKERMTFALPRELRQTAADG